MMTTRVAELWDRPPVRWTLTVLAAGVLLVGAVAYWNSRHPAQHASGPSANAYSSGPAGYGPRIPFPARVRTELRQFVSDGYLRNDPAATYDMVSPKVRAGITRAQWATGNIPLPQFPRRYFGGAGYTIVRSRQHELLLHIALASTSPKTITSLNTLVELRPIGGRWVVTYAAEYGGGPPIPAAQ